MYKSDKIDYEIITLLLEDGRMPASDIARRINGMRKTTTSILPTA
jgi:DNA-binding Lrp family transcriptional regulator